MWLTSFTGRATRCFQDDDVHIPSSPCARLQGLCTPPPKTTFSNKENTPPRTAPTSSLVQVAGRSNIGKRRIGAASLTSSPARPSHSSKMAKIFQEAKDCIRRENSKDNTSPGIPMQHLLSPRRPKPQASPREPGMLSPLVPRTLNDRLRKPAEPVTTESDIAKPESSTQKLPSHDVSVPLQANLDDASTPNVMLISPTTINNSRLNTPLPLTNALGITQE